MIHRFSIGTGVVSALAACALAGGVCHAAEKRPAPPKSKPAVQAGGQATASTQLMGYIAVPDLDALMSHMEATANVVAPGAMPPGAAKAGLAQKLGEPGLSGLSGKPIVLLLLKGQGPMAPPQPVLFLPVKDAKPYETALAGAGWKTRTAPGLVIGASTPEALLASRPVESEYRRIAGAAIPHDLRVFLNMGRLMDAYGPMMQMGMDAALARADATVAEAEKKAPAKPGGTSKTTTAAAAKILKLEAKGMVALLGQLDDVQWDIDLQGDAFSSDTVVTPRPGSALADLSRMPPAGSNRSAAMLSGSGIMTAAYQLDSARLAAFLGTIVRESATDPDAAELLTPEVSALIEQMGVVYGGEAAYRMAGIPGAPMAVESVMSVTDEAKAMAMMEKGLALLSPGGAWGALLKDTGMTMALQKSARKHAGIPVHRFKVNLNTKGLTPAMKSAQAPFVRDTEFAITRGYYLTAQDPAALDRLIDRAVAGASAEGVTLLSARAFGEGRHAYVDYDVIGLMRAASAMTPPAKGQPNPFASLPATAPDPMLSAMTFSDGRIRWQSKIPLRPFALMTEAFKKATPSPSPAPSPARKPPAKKKQ